MPDQPNLNAIYNALGEIKGTVDAIQQTQRDVKAALEKDTARVEGRVDRHDREITSINNKLNWGTGLVTAFGLVAGWFGKQMFTGSNPL